MNIADVHDGLAILEDRVAKGAALLDERMPGWEERIDLAALRLDSSSQCVLGQLYPESQPVPVWQTHGFASWADFKATYPNTTATEDETYCRANYDLGVLLLGLENPVPYGFALESDDLTDDDGNYIIYRNLDDVWKKLIIERQDLAKQAAVLDAEPAPLYKLTKADKLVAKGAALLDFNMPGWINRIDLDNLDLASGEQCVLGQLYPEKRPVPTWRYAGYPNAALYVSAMPETRKETDIICTANYILGADVLQLDVEESAKHGFVDSLKANHGNLDAAWTRLIWARKSA